MRMQRIGGFTVPAYVAQKPLMIRENGELLYPADLIKKKRAPSFGVALASPENKAKLATARLKAEPDIVFGVIDEIGRYSKAEVLRHIRDQTPLGLQFTDIEV